MEIDNKSAELGHEYYLENRVAYICVEGERGYAIVQGNRNYEVEFRYSNGMIIGLVCGCYCCGACKHEFAAVLELRNMLECISKYY